MEKKKMKLWKKILLVLLALFVIYAIMFFVKWNILSKINKNYIKSKKLSNYSYFAQEENMNITYSKKDNIQVINIEKLQEDGDITFWKDNKTGEILRFNEIDKTYSKGDENTIFIGELLPNSQSIFGIDDKLYQFLTALHPFCIITSGKFNETDCYNIYYIIDGKIKTEKIAKETGLLLYTDLYNGIRTIQYSFNTVTDDDIKKPDINQYILK